MNFHRSSLCLGGMIEVRILFIMSLSPFSGVGAGLEVCDVIKEGYVWFYGASSRTSSAIFWQGRSRVCWGIEGVGIVLTTSCCD